MDEKIKEVLDQYSFDVANAWRGRGAFICETSQGLKLIREYALSPNRLVFESMAKYMIRDRGYMNIDQITVNKEGELYSKNRYDKNFVVKDWYEGRECDMKSRDDLLAISVNLARLHKVMRHMHIQGEGIGSYFYGGMKVVFEKHCREMKSIKNYMRSRKQKNKFETMYLDYYDEFFIQAQSAVNALEGNASYEDLLREAGEEKTLCHGDYNHHNVIIMRGSSGFPAPAGGSAPLPAMATVNFDKLNVNIQVNDLYLFLRKVMEKNHWDIRLGMDIIRAYDAERPLTVGEKEYLYILMLFPEKFWKIANHYYNTRKSWTSARNQEKLEAFVASAGQRQDFLDKFYSYMTCSVRAADVNQGGDNGFTAVSGASVLM